MMYLKLVVPKLGVGTSTRGRTINLMGLEIIAGVGNRKQNSATHKYNYLLYFSLPFSYCLI